MCGQGDEVEVCEGGDGRSVMEGGKVHREEVVGREGSVGQERARGRRADRDMGKGAEGVRVV